LDSVEAACGPQWDDADRLFEQGLVTAKSFSKLFRPGEIVIRDEDGIPQAYMAEKVGAVTNTRTSLSCWTLAFDGALHHENAQILVEWRGGEKDTVAVQYMGAWPLRLDKTGLRDRLGKRGIEFWQCRHRRLVSYDGPKGSSFEFKTVSLL
jgi:hypothetical protein